MESCIQGYYIYKEVWTPFIGETLGCARERSNKVDLFAVAMKADTETVSHVYTAYDPVHLHDLHVAAWVHIL